MPFLWFFSSTLSDWLKQSRHLQKPVVTHSRTFFHASRQIQVLICSRDCLYSSSLVSVCLIWLQFSETKLKLYSAVLRLLDNHSSKKINKPFLENHQSSQRQIRKKETIFVLLLTGSLFFSRFLYKYHYCVLPISSVSVLTFEYPPVT